MHLTDHLIECDCLFDGMSQNRLHLQDPRDTPFELLLDDLDQLDCKSILRIQFLLCQFEFLLFVKQ
jgi:hypothetical protein